MARVTSIDNTEIYRTVVDVLYRGNLDADAVQTTVYGPHDAKAQNKDYNSYGWEDANPRRVTKEVLGVVYGDLAWTCYSVTYKNGGEDVNWDEF